MTIVKPQKLILLSILLFLLHGIEELIERFYLVDSIIQSIANRLQILPFTIFIALQLVLFFFLIVIAYQHFKVKLFNLSIGTLLLLELTHVWQTFYTGTYYPGTVTAIPLVVLGFYFVKELGTRN